MDIKTFLSEHGYMLDESGRVKNPGKFEGENLAAPFFWDLVMEGEGETVDVDGYEWERFEIQEDEKEAFNLSSRFYLVREDDNGFVYGIESKAEGETNV